MPMKKAITRMRQKEHEKLVKEITEKVKKELTLPKKLIPVGVKFKPGDWKVYTYLAPSDSGLSVGDKVQTPTGPAIVDVVNSAEYEPTVSYKRLRGKYAFIPFEYE